jgi:methyl-accepting chemotaxis protein
MNTEKLFNQAEVSQSLISALGIRFYITSFQVLASDLNLLSLNAQIASAKMGDDGRAFKVITSENSGISGTLLETAKRIRELTYSWTKLVAKASQDMRKLYLFDKVGPKLSKNSRLSATRMADIKKKLQTDILDYERKQPKLTLELLQIIDEMEKSLRLINYVKSGLLIESSYLDRDSASRASFQHLAEEMQNGAEKIREVASHAMSQLKQFN